MPVDFFLRRSSHFSPFFRVSLFWVKLSCSKYMFLVEKRYISGKRIFLGSEYRSRRCAVVSFSAVHYKLIAFHLRSEARIPTSLSGSTMFREKKNPSSRMQRKRKQENIKIHIQHERGRLHFNFHLKLNEYVYNMRANK